MTSLRLRSLTLAAVVLLGTFFNDAESAWALEHGRRYERCTKSPSFPEDGRETGAIEIQSVVKGRAKFNLEVTMNPVATDDGMLTRNGVIELGEMTVVGDVGEYKSTESGDTDLGVCVLRFKFERDVVMIAQEGKCWWFGEGVNASGRYHRFADTWPLVIR